MTVRTALAWALPVATLALLAPGVSAQEPPPTPPGQQEPTNLVYEREVFSYPTFQRRNPFAPLVGTNEGGPRFEQLRVLGIIYSDDAASSIAIVGTSEVTTSQDGSQVTVSPDGQAWYLKRGQSIGNIRIIEIRREQVVVEIEEFGLTEQRIMQLQTRRQGGSP